MQSHGTIGILASPPLDIAHIINLPVGLGYDTLGRFAEK